MKPAFKLHAASNLVRLGNEAQLCKWTVPLTKHTRLPETIVFFHPKNKLFYISAGRAKNQALSPFGMSPLSPVPTYSSTTRHQFGGWGSFFPTRKSTPSMWLRRDGWDTVLVVDGKGYCKP